MSTKFGFTDPKFSLDMLFKRPKSYVFEISRGHLVVMRIHFFVFQISGFILGNFPGLGNPKDESRPFIVNMFPGLASFRERDKKSA